MLEQKGARTEKKMGANNSEPLSYLQIIFQYP